MSSKLSQFDPSAGLSGTDLVGLAHWDGTKYVNQKASVDDLTSYALSNLAADTGFTLMPEHFGAKGDGVTNDTVAINNALTAAQTAGAICKLSPNKTYLVTGGQLSNPGVVLQGEGESSVLVVTGLGSALSNPYTVPGAGYALDSAALHATSLTLTASGDGAHFSADEYAIVHSSDAYDSPALDTQRKGEYVRIKAVAAGVLTLYEPLTDVYTTSPMIVPVTLTEGVEYRDFAIQMDKTVGTVGGADPGTEARQAITTRFALRPKFCNLTIRDSLGAGIALEGCIGASVDGHFCYDFGSSTNDTDGSATDGFGGYGYGISERGLNVGLVATNLYFERIRHGYTGGASYIYIQGRPVGSTISNGTHVGAKVSGWDTHDCGYGQRFDNLWSIAAQGPGFTLRGHGATVRGCGSIDCLGAAVAMYKGTGADAQDCIVDGLYSRGCNWGTDFAGTDWTGQACLLDQGDRNTIQNVVIDSCYGYLFDAGVHSSFPTLRGVRAANINANGTASFAMRLRNVGADKINIDDVVLDVSNGKVTDLIRSEANDTGNVPNINNFRPINGTISGVPFNGAGAGTNHYVNWTGPGYTGFRTTFVLNGVTTISLAGVQGSRIQITNTAGETLNTATGRSVEGAQLIVTAGSTGITITHSATGADTFFCKGAVNAVVTSGQSVTFEQRSGQWVEMWRSF